MSDMKMKKIDSVQMLFDIRAAANSFIEKIAACPKTKDEFEMSSTNSLSENKLAYRDISVLPIDGCYSCTTTCGCTHGSCGVTGS